MFDKIHRGVPVITSDGMSVGQALAHFERVEGVDPGVKLYAHYLKTFDFDIGDEYYIPAEFVDRFDEVAGKVILNVPMRKVQTETMMRMPRFIAIGKAKRTDLQSGELVHVS